MTRRIAAAALLLAIALPSLAQEQAAPPAEPTRADVARHAEAAAREDAEVDRFCLRETGSRIRTRVAKATKDGGRARCLSAQPGRVYTQEDLRSTGQTDVADALRMLDPSVY